MYLLKFEYLFHPGKETVFFPAGYFEFSPVAHNYNATFPFLLFFYMLEVDEKRFMHTEKQVVL